jgi:hypothetical protein
VALAENKKRPMSLRHRALNSDFSPHQEGHATDLFFFPFPHFALFPNGGRAGMGAEGAFI